jgi:hypothetical protein
VGVFELYSANKAIPKETGFSSQAEVTTKGQVLAERPFCFSPPGKAKKRQTFVSCGKLAAGGGSVAEVPDPGKNHGHSVAVGSFDNFLVPHGTPRLNDGGRACLGNLLHPVGEGEEGIGSGDCSF